VDPAAPRLTVVIPTRDRRDALADTLAALDRQRYEPDRVEVVVVDNGPGGATAAALAGREGRLPVRAVVEPAPGPAAARNTGVRHARAPVVLFLGDDMRPAGDRLLSRHIDLHAADPRPAFAVLGRVTWRPDKPVTAFMHWLEHGGPQFDFDALEPGRVSAARNFYTSHVSVKAAALEAVGGFDERFPFAAVEDIEIGLRLERAGLELVYHRELLVEHDHPYAPQGFRERQARVGASARLMEELHPAHGLLPAPRWSWPLHRAARPLLEALAGRRLPAGRRERVWAALAMAGYAEGWARGPELLNRAGA
jgi:GT2 family glycosyltransferase